MSSADDYDKELSGYCNEIPVIKRKWDRLFKTEGILVRFQGYFAIALFLLIVTCISTCDIQPAYADAVDVAISQIGRGEEGSDNHGKSVRKYLRGQEGLSWCAGFVSYCLEQSGVDCGYTLRARAFLKKGRIVLNPRRGDLIVFWRGNRSGNMGHVGIVEKVTDTEIVTIEGNKGAFPSKVSRFHYAKNKIGNLIGFVRVEDSNCYHNPNKTA